MPQNGEHQVCVYLDPRLGTYGFGPGHPFGTDRYARFEQAFNAGGLLERTAVTSGRTATAKDLERFHSPAYVERLAAASAAGTGFLDAGDTPAFAGVYEASLAVVGCVLDAADRIMAGDCRRAFVPIAGLHHATRDSAEGFCAVNDCALLIEHLERVHGLERVAYVDIDAHHGDGVFYAFEDDPAVIHVDFHEDGDFLYPGTGRIGETGGGRAQGRKLNVPLPPGADDALFARLWPRAELLLERHAPQFFILQAGADSLAGDPLTDLELSERTHARVARAVCALAERYAEGRVLALGGGGYNRDNLARAWCAVVAALAEE
jgi:acetoin utilization protein AcuC